MAQSYDQLLTLSNALLPQAHPALTGLRFPNFQGAGIEPPDVRGFSAWVSAKYEQGVRMEEMQQRTAARDYFLQLDKEARAKGVALSEYLRTAKLPESMSPTYQEEVYKLIGDRFGREDEAKYQGYLPEMTSLKGENSLYPQFGKVYAAVEQGRAQDPTLNANPFAKAAYDARILAARQDFETRTFDERAKEMRAANAEERSDQFARIVTRFSMLPEGASPDERISNLDNLYRGLVDWHDKGREVGSRDLRTMAFNGLRAAVNLMPPDKAQQVLQTVGGMRISGDQGFFADDISSQDELRKIEDEIAFRARRRDVLYDSGPKEAKTRLEQNYGALLQAAKDGIDPRVAADKAIEEIRKQPGWHEEWLDDTVTAFNSAVDQVRKLRPDPMEDPRAARDVERSIEQAILKLDPNADKMIEQNSQVLGLQKSLGLSNMLQALRAGSGFVDGAGIARARADVAGLKAQSKTPGLDKELEDSLSTLESDALQKASEGLGGPGFSAIAKMQEVSDLINQKRVELHKNMAPRIAEQNQKRDALLEKARSALGKLEGVRGILTEDATKGLIDDAQRQALLDRGDRVSHPLFGTGYNSFNTLDDAIAKDLKGTSAEGMAGILRDRVLTRWKTEGMKEIRDKGQGLNESLVGGLGEGFQRMLEEEQKKFVGEEDRKIEANMVLGQKGNENLAKAIKISEVTTANPKLRTEGMVQDTANLAKEIRLPPLAGDPSMKIRAQLEAPSASTKGDVDGLLIDLWRSRGRTVGALPPFVYPAEEGPAIDMARRAVEARGIMPEELLSGKLTVSYPDARRNAAKDRLEKLANDRFDLLNDPTFAPGITQQRRETPSEARAQVAKQNPDLVKESTGGDFMIPIDEGKATLFNPFQVPIIGWASMDEKQREKMAKRTGLPNAIWQQFYEAQARLSGSKPK